MLDLSHFKGHTMAGFGGALKNIAIGCASGEIGKDQIHMIAADGTWPSGEAFLERMVESGKGVADHFGDKITYVSVLDKMSVSCDCEGTNAQAVVTPDIGVLASNDILAIDKAALDLIHALPEEQRKPLEERINSRKGMRQISYMKELGMGNDDYELIEVK